MAYALFAALWLLGLDPALDALVSDAAQRAALSPYMGWVFVALTSLLLVWLLRRVVTARAAPAPHTEPDVMPGSWALLNSVAESSTDSFFARDLEGRFLMRNRASMRALPYVIPGGTSLHDLALSEDDLRQLAAHDALVVSENRTQTFIERFDTPRGRRAFQVTKGPLRNEHGQVVGVFGISRDITDAQRTADELVQTRSRLEELVQARTTQLQQAAARAAQSESFLRLLAANIPGMFCYWDRELRCRYANADYASWYGRTPEQMVGMHAREVLGNERYDQLLGLANDVLEGHTHRFELDAHSPGGRLLPTLAQYVPDVRDGTVHGFFALFIDVSELKQAQARLKEMNAELTEARDHAEAATRAKSAFLANMSHEIRTPMNAVIGLAHLLRRDDPRPSQADRLDKIRDATQHLSQVIDDILD
ncbi:MAG TPA: PAS domain-containing protein, partial [Burkholderiaceae bacterium]|nr:PAS domain-containing protein [Burkholderiaceae bacterium]